MKKIQLSKLVSFLDAELSLSRFPEDESQNGLQIEGRGTVKTIGIAVDACAQVFHEAQGKNVDFLFVHHGMIWGGIKAVKGVLKKRIKMLLDTGISLYACHLPLDGHPRYGNNAQILRLLSMKKKGVFGIYHGKHIGYWGILEHEMSLRRFQSEVDRKLETYSSVVDFGKKPKKIGVVSGSGWFAIQEAERYGIDTFLTGEPSHNVYTLAEEMKVNLVFAGHYATEIPGVRAVGRMLGKKLGLGIEFISHPTGL